MKRRGDIYYLPCPRGKKSCIFNGKPSFVRANLRLRSQDYTKKKAIPALSAITDGHAKI